MAALGCLVTQTVLTATFTLIPPAVRERPCTKNELALGSELFNLRWQPTYELTNGKLHNEYFSKTGK